MQSRKYLVLGTILLAITLGSAVRSASADPVTFNPTLDADLDPPGDPSTSIPDSTGEPGNAVIFFPMQDPFTPLLADPRQPTSNLSFFTFSNEGYGQFNGTFGADLGIVRIESQTKGIQRSIQIGIMGAGFSRFALVDSAAQLIDTDYVIGVPVTFRIDNFSARIYFYHESSHIGEDYTKLTGFVPTSNFGQEILQVTPSWDVNRHLRLYGGVSYRIVELGNYPTIGDSLILQGGFEVYGNRWKKVQARGYIAFNIESMGLTGYTPSEDFQIGVLFHRPGSYFQVRPAFDFFNGYSPMGDLPFLKETYGEMGVYFDF